MKAVVINRSVLEWRETEDPSLTDKELLARVKATALNRADLLQRKGLYPAPAGTRQDIPGLEFAGVVEWTSREHGAFKTGDRVMGLLPGEGHAEFVAAPASTLMKIPENLSFEEAAAIPEAFLTAYDALSLQLQLQPGERLLIHAVGSGVGSAALQLARAAGSETFGTSNSKLKLQKAKQLGLDHCIHAQSSDFLEIIRRKTEGSGVDAILDLVGASNWEANLQALAQCGRMILVGLVGGSRTKTDLGIVLRKRLHIMGTVLRSRTVTEKAELTKSFATERLTLFEDGTLVPVVDTVFPIEEISAAHTYMEENRNFGKIVLTIEP
jgi:putative PIG3 family NAD(P)H quinone oxidoreductase